MLWHGKGGKKGKLLQSNLFKPLYSSFVLPLPDSAGIWGPWSLSCGLVTVVVLVPGCFWEAPQTRSSLKVPFVVFTWSQSIEGSSSVLCSFWHFPGGNKKHIQVQFCKEFSWSDVRDQYMTALSWDSSDLIWISFQIFKKHAGTPLWAFRGKLPPSAHKHVSSCSFATRSHLCAYTQRHACSKQASPFVRL